MKMVARYLVCTVPGLAGFRVAPMFSAAVQWKLYLHQNVIRNVICKIHVFCTNCGLQYSTLEFYKMSC